MKPNLRFVIPIVAIAAYATWSLWSYRHMSADAATVASADRESGPRHVIYRPSTGTFYLGRLGQPHATRLGRSGAHPVGGDYDGDGLTDLGVYEAGAWVIQPTGKPLSARIELPFGGEAGDVALNGADFDGDGRDELVIYRRGTWFVAPARAPVVVANQFQFGGVAGDLPLILNRKGGPALAIFRKGEWFVDENRDGTPDAQFNYGAPGDRPVAIASGDTSVPALYRDGLWLIDTDGDRKPDRTLPLGGPKDVPVGAFLDAAVTR